MRKEKDKMRNVILREQDYEEQMKQVVEPYLHSKGREVWLEREHGKKIYVRCYQAECPKGVILISHGFTETSEKYKELIYYFLKGGYHVYIPEHCGHGHSYRLVEDLSLVHVDSYKRYVADVLYVAKAAKREHQKLNLYLFGHSMGGGIAAAAVSAEPNLFTKLILSSPMIRPLSGKIPWHDAKTIAKAFCKAGQSERYVAGQKPYRGSGKFENSSSTSRVRYDYYQTKKEENPLFQTNAASYGWLYAAACLNRDLQRDGARRIRIPVILFQSEHDHLVSKKEQLRFIFRLNQSGNTYAKLVRVPRTRHEIWGADETVLKGYLGMIFRFLSQKK